MKASSPCLSQLLFGLPSENH